MKSKLDKRFIPIPRNFINEFNIKGHECGVYCLLMIKRDMNNEVEAIKRGDIIEHLGLKIQTTSNRAIEKAIENLKEHGYLTYEIFTKGYSKSLYYKFKMNVVIEEGWEKIPYQNIKNILDSEAKKKSQLLYYMAYKCINSTDLVYPTDDSDPYHLEFKVNRTKIRDDSKKLGCKVETISKYAYQLQYLGAYFFTNPGKCNGMNCVTYSTSNLSNLEKANDYGVAYYETHVGKVHYNKEEVVASMLELIDKYLTVDQCIKMWEDVIANMGEIYEKDYLKELLAYNGKHYKPYKQLGRLLNADITNTEVEHLSRSLKGMIEYCKDLRIIKIKGN